MENENVNVESKEMVVTGKNTIQGLEGFKTNKNQKSNINTITNITDYKKLFNLENSIDYKLNDCVGEKIRVKEMLCKVIETPLETPIVNTETGEIEKTAEYKMITILVDDNEKSYVTASKTFYFAWKKLCQGLSVEEFEKGIDIEIIKTPTKNSDNKALNFKLI